MHKPLPIKHGRSGHDWLGLWVKAFPWAVLVAGLLLGILVATMGSEAATYFRQHGWN